MLGTERLRWTSMELLGGGGASLALHNPTLGPRREPQLLWVNLWIRLRERRNPVLD